MRSSSMLYTVPGMGRPARKSNTTWTLDSAHQTVDQHCLAVAVDAQIIGIVGVSPFFSWRVMSSMAVIPGKRLVMCSISTA